ncbi:hypothetical protein BDV19DRAFT_360962 [Aspergillus venezuelensis]
MNNRFARALARALPSVGRQAQLRVSPLCQTRAFSSTPKTFNESQSQGDSKADIVDTSRNEAANDPLPSPSVKASDLARSSANNAFSKMAFALEADVLNRPYDNSPPYHIHVLSHKHNTVLTLTRPNGSPLISYGTGVLGFRKARRGGYDPAFNLSAHFFGQIQEKGLLLNIKKIEIIFRGFHQGRQAFTKALMGNEGKNIRGLVSGVSDSTRIKFGGTRSPRVRRL